MLEGAFSFRGRLKRLPYFLGGLVLLAAVFLVALALGVLLTTMQHSVGAIVGVGAIVVGLIVAMLWYSLSLQARRIRDIGWDPTIVLVGFFAFAVADKLVLVRLLPALAVGHGPQHGTLVGMVVSLGYSLVLLFWPSRDDDGGDRASYAAPRPTRSAPDIRPAPVMSRSIGAPRKEFGRRGLS